MAFGFLVHFGQRGEACLGNTIASDEVALQHERDVVSAGFADRCLRDERPRSLNAVSRKSVKTGVIQCHESRSKPMSSASSCGFLRSCAIQLLDQPKWGADST